MSDFNAANMPTTPRHGIRYPGPTDLVRHASQQFQAMAESIDDNIDDLPAEITARVDDAATRAAASATAAQQAAATAGTLADSNMAVNINNSDSQTAAALDKWRNAGNRWHNAVIIGDSLCKGFYSSAEHAGQGIGDVICKNLGIDTVQNMAVSGSGFTVGGDNTFVKQWERVSNKSNVDLVLVIGGVNDNNADCSAAVTQLLNAIKQNAPKATTYVFPVAGGLGMSLHEHHFALHTISHATLAQTATTNRRVVLMQGVHRWGQMIGEDEADGYIHMKQAGYQKWAAIATRLIKNGQNTFWPTFARDLTVTPVSGDTLFDQTQRARMVESNGTITLQITAHSKRAIDAGFTIFKKDAYFMNNVQDKFIGLNVNGCAISVGTGGIKMQMAQFPRDRWLLVETSWVAGMRGHGMDTELLTLVAALIGSGAATSVVQWILGHAERDTPTKEGLRVLLFCKLEHIQAAMVANDGVCDVSTKETAETIYRAYSALGGNGVGSQMIEDIRHAHIARTEE